MAFQITSYKIRAHPKRPNLHEE